MILDGPVDLPHSLLGGQAFLWTHEGGAFRGVVEGRAWTLRALPEGAVEARGAPRAAIARYFRLEPADAARRARLAHDPVLAPALAAFPGLRLLRQDPWEATVAFLTSANNHVPRIERILRTLVARYGEGVGKSRGHGTPVGAPMPRAFPTPERFARAPEPALRAAGLGYRAPFLRATAGVIARGEVDLAALRGASHAEAREVLTALPGVGPKVADCIALFALDVDDAFPIDRWMLRAMEDAFGRAFRPREAEAFARERWGRDAGLAQQYLFHAIRLRSGAPGVGRYRTGPESRGGFGAVAQRPSGVPPKGRVSSVKTAPTRS